jgi:hypothetical protein
MPFGFVPKRQSTAALQNLTECVKAFQERDSVVECGIASPEGPLPLLIDLA